VVAISNVGWNESFQYLEPVVEPAAKIVHKSAGAANDGSHFPQSLVGFEARAEACELARA